MEVTNILSKSTNPDVLSTGYSLLLKSLKVLADLPLVLGLELGVQKVLMRADWFPEAETAILFLRC